MLRFRQYWGKETNKRVEFSIGGFKMYGGWGTFLWIKKIHKRP